MAKRIKGENKMIIAILILNIIILIFLFYLEDRLAYFEFKTSYVGWRISRQLNPEKDEDLFDEEERKQFLYFKRKVGYFRWYRK